MERLLTTSVERDGAEPVLLCSNTYDDLGRLATHSLGGTAEGSYADSTGYHYQVKDYRGDVRLVVAQDGTIEETNGYYPYGMLHGISAIASTQPYKYTGKELDRENGLDWYDSQARMLISDLGSTTTMDPLAEKYYSISPYLWCAGNPVKFVDPDGQTYLVTDLGAQQAILNTLSKTDAPYVQFNDNGYLNRNLLLSHHSSSNNYNIICEIEQASEIVTVEMNDKFKYKDNNNVIQDSDVMSYSIDEDFIDNEVTGAYSNTTGEMGRLGIALLPGKGKSNVNSIDENIHVILNKNLSKEGAAANISHEVNGHVLMYLRTHDRQLSGHDYDGNREKNRHLYEMILNSLIETITNLRTNE